MANSNRFLQAATPAALIIVLTLGLRLLPTNEDNTPRSGEAMAQQSPQAKVTTADAKTQKTLETVVNGQLDAFRKDNYGLALTYSTSDFRKQWTPDTFKGIIERGFPEMTRYTRAEYRPAKLADGNAIVYVMLFGDKDSKSLYAYSLKQEEGTWRIVNAFPVKPRRRSDPANPPAAKRDI